MNGIADLRASIQLLETASIGDFGPPIADVTMNGFKLINVADPINDTDAVPKKYVDALQAAVTTNIAGLETRVTTLEAGGGGGGQTNASDLPARDAIGWPYSNAQSLNVRTNAVFNDLAIVKG